MRSTLVPALVGLAFVTLAIAVALGLRALAGDVERARSRYAEQASGLASAAVAALEEARAEAKTGAAGAIAFRGDAEGGWLEPQLEAPVPGVRTDGQLREFLEREIDELERTGRGADAERRLREIAAGTDPELAAWAWTWIAANASRDDRIEDARAAWSTLAANYPDARDEHGLKRALAARWRLAELESAPVDALAQLHAELIADRVALEQTATAALADELAERVRAVAPERAPELDRSARERTRLLQLLASWPTGMSDWIARGAPGGERVFDLVPDPLEAFPAPQRVLVSVERDGDGWRGAALELERLAQAAFERAEVRTRRELGFEAAIEDARGRVLAGAAPPGDAPVAVDRARPPLEELSVRAFGTDFEGFVAAERSRFRMVASLSIGALVAGALAAIATLRAVRRESRVAREREAFVAAVTHELKTPLASIRLFAELLERGDVDSAKVREFGARTVAESDRLSRLVDGVLRFARLQSNALDGAELPPVDLGEVARLAAASVEPMARERGFELAVRAADGPLLVRADRDALVGAVAELVDNATKYGGAASTIEVVVERRGPRGVIAVLDRGPGVPEAERERIFEPFHRLGDELTRERAGVGLGLALVRGVAQSHRGTVRYSSREGGGSRFELELPLEPARARASGGGAA